MKAVIQRVSSAEVKTENQIVGSIKKGYFVLLGIHKNDTSKDVDDLVNKIIKIRLMPDESKKMNLSLVNTKASLLVVSQFTLYGNTKKGNRPSFVDAMEPKKAEKLYNKFIRQVKSTGIHIDTGKFGQYMIINANLDGPVTIILES